MFFSFLFLIEMLKLKKMGQNENSPAKQILNRGITELCEMPPGTYDSYITCIGIM